MSKRLYTSFSFSNFIWYLALRLICIIGIIYFTTIYNENPAVILFFIIVCSISIFTLGDDKISIYNDKIVQTDNSFYSLLFKSNDKTYLIADIKLTYIPKETTSSKTETGVAAIMIFFLPKRRSHFNHSSSIFFELKNGETKELKINLGENKMINLVKDINVLVKSNVIL